MAHVSASDLLALHGVRVLGFGSSADVAARYRVDAHEVKEHLLDAEAFGWVARAEFAGSRGWSLTDRGRAENERRLAAELAATGARETVAAAYGQFEPLNTRFTDACTRWQLRPAPGGRLLPNDHTDHRWDDRVLDSIRSTGRSLARLLAPVEAELSRFAGYPEWYNAALAHVERGRTEWVDAPGRSSCHTAWMQLHEDLVATLGITRGRVD